MLKGSFENLNVIGTPWETTVAFLGISVGLLILTWGLLLGKEFPD